MEEQGNKIDKGTQIITRLLLKIILSGALVVSVMWFVADKFGMIEAPKEVKEFVQANDSIIKAETDSMFHIKY